MPSRKCLAAVTLALFTAGTVGAPSARADPLTPLTPGELQFLDHARQVLPVTHDPMAFRSDGELLVAGHYVCDKRAIGYGGYSGTLVTPAVIQLAFHYLCPS